MSTEKTGIKYLDLKEFKTSGLLQEVNRQFFHPRGLALEVLVDHDGQVTGLGGIQDFRDDPEGVWMVMDADRVARGNRVQAALDARVDARVERLGWLIQPLREQGREHPKTGL